VTEDLAQYGLFIDGIETSAKDGASFLSENPALGAPWAEIAKAHLADVEVAVQAAMEAQHMWAELSPTRRGRILGKLADVVEDHAEHIAAIETRDNGKLLRESVAQMRVVPDWLRYFAGLADKVEGSVIPLDRRNILNYTLLEPLGVVGIITPWNSPIFLTTMALAPALAAGNSVVAKPSEYTSASIVEVARLTSEAGLPPGLVNVVTGGSDVGAALVGHPGIAKVAFTGGSRSGAAVAKQLSGRLARYTLELGGKSPNVVFEDADLTAAEAGVVSGIFAAAGQTCIAGSRVLISRAVYNKFVSRLVERAAHIRLGDPMDPQVQMGPIATPAQFEKIDRMVTNAVDAGARVLTGGHPVAIPEVPGGHFYAPTILSDVAPGSEMSQEEVFGPVAIVAPFESEDEAIVAANETRYGLAAGVWTNDLRRAHRVAAQIKVGTVWINTYRALAFNSPFGGYKESGIGRANGTEAIREYLQVKSVWCELSEDIRDPFVLKV